MGHLEDSGYVRLSRSGALYAFHTDAGGTSWVNLRWLADVIRDYDAGGRRLSSPKPEDEYVAGAELEILRPAVEHVDSERVAYFNKEHDHR